MSGTRPLGAALLACCAAVACGDSRGGDPAVTPPTVRVAASEGRETDDTRTVAIALPHDEPSLPDGPGRRQFITSCVVCHSTRYITMQPNFTQPEWVTIVHKMVADFGAHLTPEEEGDVVRYIMTIRGEGEAGIATAAGHPESGHR